MAPDATLDNEQVHRLSLDEYWVIDLEGRRAVVYREPRGDGYADVAEIASGDELLADSLDIGAIALGDLLHAAYA